MILYCAGLFSSHITTNGLRLEARWNTAAWGSCRILEPPLLGTTFMSRAQRRRTVLTWGPGWRDLASEQASDRSLLSESDQNTNLLIKIVLSMRSNNSDRLQAMTRRR